MAKKGKARVKGHYRDAPGRRKGRVHVKGYLRKRK